jgi:hypothetical protein
MTFAFRGLVGLWGVAMLLAGLPACGSSSGKCTTNCADAATGGSSGGHDAAGTGGTGGTKQDAAVDHANQTDMATKGDGARDMSIDLAHTCDQSLTVACSETHDAGSFSAHCALTWDDTTKNAYLCARPETTVLTTTCGDYRELTDTANNGSEEYIYIYDATGDLVAVIHGQFEDGGFVTHCIGGSAGFVAPSCSPTPKLFSCPKDGGTRG